jgi:MFS family permease
MTEHFTARQRRLSLLALDACVFGVGIAFGALVPLITLRLAHQGVDATLIGLNAAMFPLAVLLVGPFLPHLLHRLGAVRSMCFGLCIVAITILMFPALPYLPAWFVLRFLTGAAGAIPWVVSETWLNMVATDRDRGRIMGIYATVLAAGFAIGPAIIGAIGVEGWRPFLIVALAAANVVFVMVYQIGGASGPTLAGTAIDLIGSEGLVVVVAAAATMLALAFFKFRPR